MLGLDAWWDEPAYKAAQDTLAERGALHPRRARGRNKCGSPPGGEPSIEDKA